MVEGEYPNGSELLTAKRLFKVILWILDIGSTNLYLNDNMENPDNVASEITDTPNAGQDCINENLHWDWLKVKLLVVFVELAIRLKIKIVL